MDTNDREGYTQEDRQAIEKIRRELDAEFGPIDRTPLPRFDDVPPEREDTALLDGPPERDAAPPVTEPRGTDVETAPSRDATPRSDDRRPADAWPRSDEARPRPTGTWSRPEPRPLHAEPRPLHAEPPFRHFVPPDAGAESSWQPTSAPRAVAYGPITGRRRRRGYGTSMFIAGALVGGIAGGIAGSTAAVLWQSYVDDVVPLARSAAERSATDSPSAAPLERGTEAGTVQSALNTWLEATRRGDVERQMNFYPARVPVYYTWRDVPRASVRDDKLKVFGGATRLEITTDTPTVELVDGGRGAVARFRKRYVIEGPATKRRGEVVQEVRWARTTDGWRIVSERDAEVLAR